MIVLIGNISLDGNKSTQCGLRPIEIIDIAYRRNPHDPMRWVAAYLQFLPQEEVCAANKELCSVAFMYLFARGREDLIERYDL